MGKLKVMLVAAVIICSLAAGVVKADKITVSSTTATALVPANGTVRNVSIFNDGAGVVDAVLYIGTALSSSTVAAGFPVASSTTVQVYDLKGPVYGILAAGAASRSVRTLPVKQ